MNIEKIKIKIKQTTLLHYYYMIIENKIIYYIIFFILYKQVVKENKNSYIFVQKKFNQKYTNFYLVIVKITKLIKFF